MAIRSYKCNAPRIAPSAYVDASAVVIGDVEIGEDSSVWPMCVVRGDVNHVRIGARTSIQDGTVIHVTHRHAARPEGQPTVIGSDVTIGHRVILHGCTIEDKCLIGMGSILLDGAVIRSRVLLGAGSLVTESQDLEGGYLWLGQPARRVRPLSEEEMARFEYSARHYVQLKNDYHK
jgi:carbonic anhydrase/acetyltransferase-like protein (isoleucine patch superfamily)